MIMDDQTEKVVSDLFQQISINLQDKKKEETIKVREFEWYELETKIRVFVYRLIEPHLKTFQEQKQLFMKQKSFDSIVTQNKVELDDFKQIYYSQGKGVPIVDQLKLKIEEVQTQMREMKHEFEKHSKLSEIKIDKYIFEHDFLKNQIQNIENQKTNLHDQFVSLNTSCSSFKDDIQKIIDNINEEVVFHETFTRNELGKFDQSLIEIKEKNNKFRLEIEELRGLADSSTNQIYEHFKLISQLKFQVESMKQETKQISVIQESQKQLNHSHHNNLQKLETLENYIEIYQPIFTQGQISDTLHNVLDPDMRVQLAEYEQRAFPQFHNIVANDSGKPQLNEHMKTYVQLIQNILLRNKDVLKNKKEYVVSNAFKINGSFNIGQSEQLIELEEEDNVSAQAIQNVKDVCKKFHDESQQDFLNLKNCVLNDLEYLKRKQSDHEDQMFLSSQHSLGQIEQIRSEGRQQYEKFLNKVQEISEDQSSYLSQIYENQQQILFIHKAIQLSFSFDSIISQLIIQDEIDKQSLGLYGVKDEFSQNPLAKNSIKIDDNCLSCSGNPALIKQAFKIACISYHPNEVILDGKAFKKEQILEIAQNILKQIKIIVDDKRVKTFQKTLENQLTKSDLNSKSLKQTDTPILSNFSGKKRTNDYQYLVKTASNIDTQEVEPRQTTYEQMRKSSLKSQSQERPKTSIQGSIFINKNNNVYILGKNQQDKVSKLLDLQQTECQYQSHQATSHTNSSINKRILFSNQKNYKKEKMNRTFTK